MGKHDGLPPPPRQRGRGAHGRGRELPGPRRAAPPQPTGHPKAPELAGRPVRESGGASVKCRGQATAAHRPSAGAARRAGEARAALSLSPTFPAGSSLPCLARPCPVPAPRPPGPAFLAGACGFLPAPGARSWLAAGRGTRREPVKASAREGRREGAPPGRNSSPSRGARPPRGPGAPGGHLVWGDSAEAVGPSGPGGIGAGERGEQVCNMRERPTARPPSLRS